jgi:putative transposase
MRIEGHAVESICRVLREQDCQVAARTYGANLRGLSLTGRSATP